MGPTPKMSYQMGWTLLSLAPGVESLCFPRLYRNGRSLKITAALGSSCIALKDPGNYCAIIEKTGGRGKGVGSLSKTPALGA